MSISLAELAARVDCTLDGDGSIIVRRVATLASADTGSVSFLANSRYRRELATTRAAAVIIDPALAGETRVAKLLSANPYATYAKVAAILHPGPARTPGIHPTAVVAPDARIARSAAIGPHVAIGPGAVVGERVAIGAGCSIGARAVVGDDTLLHANVTIYDECTIGRRGVVHSGAVIGADGFGMAEEAGRWLKIPQIGRVVIGDDVEIGANTTIDRGAIDDTIIEDDVKLDNQIQIAHNCRIGAHTAIAGCVGIAGSAHVGRNCRIGGAAMIGGHITIADGVVVGAATQIYDSIATAGVYTGAFPALPHREWVHVASAMRRLQSLEARLHALERAAAGEEGGSGGH